MTSTLTLRRVETLPAGHDWIALEVDGRAYVCVRQDAGDDVVAEAMSGAALLN